MRKKLEHRIIGKRKKTRISFSQTNRGTKTAKKPRKVK